MRTIIEDGRTQYNKDGGGTPDSGIDLLARSKGLSDTLKTDYATNQSDIERTQKAADKLIVNAVKYLAGEPLDSGIDVDKVKKIAEQMKNSKK